MQQSGGHQIAILISDLVDPIMPRGQPCDDHLIQAAVSAQRDEPSVAYVIVCYVALADQLHRASGRFGVKGAQGGFVWVSSGGENEMSMRDGNKEGQV